MALLDLGVISEVRDREGKRMRWQGCGRVWSTVLIQPGRHRQAALDCAASSVVGSRPCSCDNDDDGPRRTRQRRRRRPAGGRRRRSVRLFIYLIPEGRPSGAATSCLKKERTAPGALIHFEPFRTSELPSFLSLSLLVIHISLVPILVLFTVLPFVPHLEPAHARLGHTPATPGISPPFLYFYPESNTRSNSLHHTRSVYATTIQCTDEQRRSSLSRSLPRHQQHHPHYYYSLTISTTTTTALSPSHTPSSRSQWTPCEQAITTGAVAIGSSTTTCTHRPPTKA